MTIKIHAATAKRAAKYGIELSATDTKVSAIHHGFGISEIGMDPRATLENAIMKVELAKIPPAKEIDEDDLSEDEDDLSEDEDEDEDIPERINGIPTDGRVAYEEGVMTADCPFDDPDSEQAIAWYEAWDAAADEAESDDKAGGSVVSEKYRAKYAELGHPTTCGDELANILDEWCKNAEGTNMELFEDICAMNGVDMSKYNRTSRGWQGRFRMTGRNMLAKAVYRSGILKLPSGEHKMGGEWLTAQRYKMPKSEQTNG